MNRREHDSTSLTHEGAAQLTVRLGALRANYRAVESRVAGVTVAPVVKADAYSLGVGPVARALTEAGADIFFVARLEEGIALRLLNRSARIVVLDGVMPGTAPALAAHALTPTLNSLDELSEWSAFARGRKERLSAILHVDTGMNRSGLSGEDVSVLSARARELLTGIELVLIMSHLACADEPEHPLNRTQLERFRSCLARLPPAAASLAASAGIELGRDYAFDMVRPGIALYGGNPVPARPNPYQPVVRLTSRVLQVRQVGKGVTVGYGAAFTTARPSSIALVAAGYADGLIRASSATGFAAIAGHRAPFAGRVSMDLAVLDVTDLPPGLVARGAEVEFLGDAVSLSDAASAAGTIAHEVLTSITPRARRIYVDE